MKGALTRPRKCRRMDWGDKQLHSLIGLLDCIAHLCFIDRLARDQARRMLERPTTLGPQLRSLLIGAQA
jgi:hypothetical protein